MQSEKYTCANKVSTGNVVGGWCSIPAGRQSTISASLCAGQRCAQKKRKIRMWLRHQERVDTDRTTAIRLPIEIYQMRLARARRSYDVATGWERHARVICCEIVVGVTISSFRFIQVINGGTQYRVDIFVIRHNRQAKRLYSGGTSIAD